MLLLINSVTTTVKLSITIFSKYRITRYPFLLDIYVKFGKLTSVRLECERYDFVRPCDLHPDDHCSIHPKLHLDIHHPCRCCVSVSGVT